MPPKETELHQRSNEARDALVRLSITVREGVKPPSGPYAFFHHLSHATTRVQDVENIIKRLCSQRRRLSELAQELHSRRSDDWPPGTPYPEDIQVLMREDSDLSQHMMLDMESLYMFGGILLDQWALIAIAIGSLTALSKAVKKEHPYRELVDYFDRGGVSPTLGPLWEKLKPQLLELHYQLRFYRNRFIVHANRPWQRGTSRTSVGDDFILFIPSPPGWNDEETLDRQILSLVGRTTDKSSAEAGNDARTVIQEQFRNIASVSTHAERDTSHISSEKKVVQLQHSTSSQTTSCVSYTKELVY